MKEIVVALDVQLWEGERQRVWSHGTTNVEAWECVRLSAPVILGHQNDQLPKAFARLNRALELDPEYAIAWVMLGWYHQIFAEVVTGLNRREKVLESVAKMRACADQALAIDKDCADAYSLLALAHMELREFEEAMSCAEKSVELAPGNAENLAEASVVMTKC